MRKLVGAKYDIMLVVIASCQLCQVDETEAVAQLKTAVDFRLNLVALSLGGSAFVGERMLPC